MFATVTRWTLNPSVRSRDVLDVLLPEMTSNVIKLVRAQGILDVIMVEAPDDHLTVISSYESESAATASGPNVLKFMNDHYADKITLVSRTVGQAYEPSALLANDSESGYS